MPKWQRLTMGTVALLASVALGLVSLLANMKFAETLGSTEFEKKLMMAAGIGSDLLKIAVPMAALLFWRRKAWLPLSATLAVGAVVIAFSLSAAFGFVGGERWANFDRLNNKVVETQRTESRIKRMELNSDWAQVTKPVAVLEAERAAKFAEPDYRAAAFCNATKTPAQVTLCREIKSIDVQIETAKAQKAQEQQVDELAKKVADGGRVRGDAQVMTMRHLTGFGSDQSWLMAMIVLGVLLIELGSTLGPTIALGLLMKDAQTPLGRIVGQAVGSVVVTPQGAFPVAPDPGAVHKLINRQQQDAERTRVDVLKKERRSANFPEPAAAKRGGGLASLLTPIPTRPRAKGKVA